MKYKITIITFVVLAVLMALVALPLVLGFGRTGKNTQILGKDYSLLTKKDIKDHLTVDFPLPPDLILKTSNREFTLNLSSVSAKVNQNQIASDLLFRRLNQGIKKYFTAFFAPKNFSLEVSINDTILDSYLEQVASQIDKPFIPSELNLDQKSNTIVVKDGETGQKTDIDTLKILIVSALSNYQLSLPIEIPLTSVGQLPQDSEVQKSKLSAAKLIGKTLEFTAPDQEVTLDDKTLISWLDFYRPCRADRLQEYINGLKTSLKKDPVEPVFKFENNKVLEFQPSQNGYVLNDTNLEQLICTNITQLMDTTDKKITASFPVTVLEPKFVNSQVNDMGIKELLGRGKSTFKHSSDIRNYNVEKGASIINRILVAPDETFSFIKNLGEVTLDNGFKKAYVIKKGKTELDVGGGICQVSTTLFRAMLDAGLDITDRHPHAYRVGYYEEDSPPGYDATVFIPNPDLKFLNDTGHYVLIQSTYDGKNKTLVYEIYGTSDGRKTEISNYRRWDSTPPPPDVYIDDPTLPPGKVVQDEHRIAGLKTAFDWKVTRNEEIIHQKTFQSSYVPWAAVFRRGPVVNP
jgi:vancomycin resistance protein YoaR